jgi:hypothetical protein
MAEEFYAVSIRCGVRAIPPFRKERGRMGLPALWELEGWATRLTSVV